MSLSSLLNIARSALLIQQRAMSVTGHNVANAQTPGYSRQRLDLRPATPQMDSFGLIGRGVSEEGITRARDTFYDAVYRRESGLLGGADARHTLLQQIESAVNEPSDDGVAAALDGLFRSFADLANDPASAASRNIVRSAASRLVDLIHQLDTQLSQTAADATRQIENQVDQVNDLTSRIARLNTEIVGMKTRGETAPDLQDQRDALIDELSGLVAVHVSENKDGSLAVSAGGAVLVDNAVTQMLETKRSPGSIGVGTSLGADPIDLAGGSLAALVTFASETLPGYGARLDEFAAALVAEFNAIHSTGYNADGDTGVNFFDPAGVTAHTISLSADVEASADAIAAGVTDMPGDNSLALELAALGRREIASLGGMTFGDHYADFSSDVGTRVREADQDASTFEALAGQADAVRSSVSGVSVDEEMLNLIGQQQAYSAATRLLRVADEMVQELLQIV